MVAWNKTVLGGGVVFALSCVVACGGSSTSESAKGGSGGTSGTTGGTGGTTGGTGGTTGGTGGSITFTTDCPAFTPCGGDIVGAWRMQSICGALTTSTGSQDCVNESEMLTLGGDALYTLGADGTLTITGNLLLAGDLSVTEACAQAMGTTATEYCALLSAAGAAAGSGGTGAGGTAGTSGAAGSGGSATPNIDISCMLNASVCNCHVVEGPVPIDNTSPYQIVGNSYVVNGGSTDYCVDGNTLTIAQTSSSGALSVAVLVPN